MCWHCVLQNVHVRELVWEVDICLRQVHEFVCKSKSLHFDVCSPIFLLITFTNIKQWSWAFRTKIREYVRFENHIRFHSTKNRTFQMKVSAVKSNISSCKILQYRIVVVVCALLPFRWMTTGLFRERYDNVRFQNSFNSWRQNMIWFHFTTIFLAIP